VKNFTVITVSVALIFLVVIVGLTAIWLVYINSETATNSVSDGLLNKDCSYPWGLVRAGRCVDRELGVVCYTISDSISCLEMEGLKE